MITINNLTHEFDGVKLFSDVNLKFTSGNCYGVIGANGAGKSTLLKILSNERECTKGDILIPETIRMSVLKQDHFQYDDYTVLDTIIMGNKRLYDIMKQKDALYMKENFTEEDGILASELEGEFAELNGWEVETEAGKLLAGLGLSQDLFYNTMNSLSGAQKVKVLLAQALFLTPEIILLDEPTNNLDINAIEWLENFILNYDGTIIVVSHDRHFLNTVCTHIIDIDYGKIKMYVGNYDFWYESSKLMQRLLKEKNKKAEEKIKDLKDFIARFSANKSKSNQATSRRKLIDKLTPEEMPASSRKYPFVGFTMDRELGKDVLFVDGISKTVDGEKVLNNISFTVNKGDKIAIIANNEIAQTTLFKILTGEIEPDSGSFKWGVSASYSYLPKDNSEFFKDDKLSIIKWLEQYSKDTTETYLRGFLGRMIFSGDDVLKSTSVLSGGEKVRCMLSKMMLYGSNVLILDQPTNHLDLESITAVNNGLIDFKGNVIFSSYDHQFTQTIANRIIEITDNGIVDRISTYDEFIEWKKLNK